MNILYVYAHPNPDSFNSLLKQHGCLVLEASRHNVVISDLYAQQFNPVASWNDFDLPESELDTQYFMSQKIAYDRNALADDVKAEIEKISQADHLIFQFPLWWFSVPAILKGWLDRVFVKGFAYDSGRVFESGLLKGKTASLVVTTQSPEDAYKQTGTHHSTIDAFLHPIHHTLRFSGIQTQTPFIVYGAFDIAESRKINILDLYQSYLQNYHPR